MSDEVQLSQKLEAIREKERRPTRRSRAKQIIELYTSGHSPKLISERLGCSLSVVYSILHSDTVWRVNPKLRPLSNPALMLRKLHRAGLSMSLLAHLLGVSKVAIFKALRRAGAPARKREKP